MSDKENLKNLCYFLIYNNIDMLKLYFSMDFEYQNMLLKLDSYVRNKIENADIKELEEILNLFVIEED